jgi:hypothetical protein
VLVVQVATEVVLGGNLETWIVHSRKDKEVRRCFINACYMLNYGCLCFACNETDAGRRCRLATFASAQQSLRRFCWHRCPKSTHLDAVQPSVHDFDRINHNILVTCYNAQALFKLATQIKMRRPTVVEANFDRPPYSIPASRQVPQGWTTLRQFVQVEHPHYAHIIDNKLMDMVRNSV